MASETGSGASVRLLFPTLAVTLFTVVAVAIAMTPGRMPDLFIYRLGAELTIRGETPYDIDKVRQYVAAEFPEENPKPESLVNNCGYFLPPQAVLLFMPLAMLPWPVAKVVWAVLDGLAAVAIVSLPSLFWNQGLVARATAVAYRFALLPKLVPLLLVVNFLTIAIVMVGQTTIIAVGCVAAGLWCFARGGMMPFWVGVLLWSVPFVKPHVALLLIPLAGYLGGWQRLAALVGVVAVFNVLGATLIGGSPLYLRDYANYLSDSHRVVLFNRAELNYEITSWNRLLYVVTEPFAGNRFLIEQNMLVTVASLLVWCGLVVMRVVISGVRPSAGGAVAATVAGAVWCPQVLGYEALMLVLAVPWIRDLLATSFSTYGWAAAALLIGQTVPFQVVEPLGFTYHRPLFVALFALLVLLGPDVASVRPSAA